jgi:hypothetical protein
MLRWSLKVLGPVVGLGLFLLALLWIGKVAWEHIRQQDRYTVALADVDCTPPPGQSRADFLDEVQYLAGLPDRFPYLEEDLARRLAEAFARHPRVEKVVRVELVPPRQVRVELVYRTPVLAVPLAGETRVVDGSGVLLPKGISPNGLPVFKDKCAPPRGPAGTPWGDPAVEAAAIRASRKDAKAPR